LPCEAGGAPREFRVQSRIAGGVSDECPDKREYVAIDIGRPSRRIKP
jgi:hypothetical protein